MKKLDKGNSGLKITEETGEKKVDDCKEYLGGLKKQHSSELCPGLGLQSLKCE